MSVKALGTYDYPARDRQEVYGDDQLVHVQWDGNMLFCSAACFRVPKSMTWSDFKSQVIDPWASGDPDYRSNDATDWRLDEEPINPKPDETLEGLGIVHKGLIRFRTAA